jgi:hypothetical protein
MKPGLGKNESTHLNLYPFESSCQNECRADQIGYGRAQQNQGNSRTFEKRAALHEFPSTDKEDKIEQHEK